MLETDVVKEVRMSLLSTVKASGPRLHYLDWLRVLSMLAVFLYHNNRFFDSGDWHVKNSQLSHVSTIVENGMGWWLMPVLFTVSGAAVFYSLKSRSAGMFARERFLRLEVPLLTLGTFVFGPWQIYLERLTHGGTCWIRPSSIYGFNQRTP